MKKVNNKKSVLEDIKCILDLFLLNNQLNKIFQLNLKSIEVNK